MRTMNPRSVSLLRSRLGGLALVVAGLGLGASAAHADAPVSVGTRGAIQRAALTQNAARKGSAASFGTPFYDESRGFGFKLRVPFYLAGAEADAAEAAIVPYAVKPGRVLPGAQSNVLGLTSNIAYEDLGSFASYIPAIEIGEERKAFHLQLGVLSQRIGHGSIVDWFTNSPEGAERRLGLLVEANSASLGGQAMVGDVFCPGCFAAGRVYGRPILWFVAPDSLIQPNDLDLDPRSEVAGIWVSGITVAVDGFSPTNAANPNNSPAVVYAAGWDNEASILDNKLIKLMGKIDINMLGTTPGGPRRGFDNPVYNLPMGFGIHPGARINLELPVAVDVDAEFEYNFGTAGYIPRYFDRIYFIERSGMWGTEDGAGVRQTKATADAPASHGYNLRVSATLFKTVSLFLEARDQFPFLYQGGATNSGMLTGGAAFFFMFFGGSVTASQAGIINYMKDVGVGGPGFILTAEGRIALLANVVHIVGRHYIINEPNDVNLIDRSFTTTTGTIVGLEINFDLNTPFPLF